MGDYRLTGGAYWMLAIGIVCIVVFVLSNPINYTYILLAIGIACVVDFAKLWGAVSEFNGGLDKCYRCKQRHIKRQKQEQEKEEA